MIKYEYSLVDIMFLVCACFLLGFVCGAALCATYKEKYYKDIYCTKLPETLDYVWCQSKPFKDTLRATTVVVK